MAQTVERVLGKDEVTSSNLVSSSRKTLEVMRLQGFLFYARIPPRGSTVLFDYCGGVFGN